MCHPFPFGYQVRCTSIGRCSVVEVRHHQSAFMNCDVGDADSRRCGWPVQCVSCRLGLRTHHVVPLITKDPSRPYRFVSAQSRTCARDTMAVVLSSIRSDEQAIDAPTLTLIPGINRERADGGVLVMMDPDLRKSATEPTGVSPEGWTR